MKNQLQKVALLALMILAANVNGQVQPEPNRTGRQRVTTTYLDLLLNAVGTNFNYGKANHSLSDYKKSALGAQVGASFQAGITPQVSLVTELYFIMKGGQLNAYNPLTFSKTTLRFYTIELPVLARFHAGRFYVNVGPSLACNLYGTQNTEGTSGSVSFNHSDSGFRRLDAGIQAGAGYRFKLKDKSVVLDVRYSNGLTNLSHSQEMYNRYLNISLHFSKPWKTNPLAKIKPS